MIKFREDKMLMRNRAHYRLETKVTPSYVATVMSVTLKIVVKETDKIALSASDVAEVKAYLVVIDEKSMLIYQAN